MSVTQIAGSRQIKQSSITLDRLQDIPTGMLLGRQSAGTGPVELVNMPTVNYQAQWNYSNNATMADPGNGRIRSNTTVLDSATQLAISKNDSGGVDRTNFLETLQSGDIVLIQSASNASDWVRFQLTSAPINNTTWWLFPVTLESGSGVTPANNESLMLNFSATGGGGGGGSGTGTVTSVGLTLPSQFTVSGSPVTAAGILTGAWASQAQNSVLAGPTSGSGIPTFRALTTGDLPAGTGTVTSVGITGPSFVSWSSPVTTSGTLTGTWINQNANLVLAGPISGGAAAPTFRALTSADLPMGTGTVTSVSVVTANGISGSVANPTTTPAITLALGNITPSSVAAAGTVTGANLSGTNTGDQTITLTGNVTGSGTGSFVTTIAAGAVTYARMQNTSAASVLLGRGSASGAGAVQEITLGSGLSMSGTTLSASSGTVTSVALALPAEFGVFGSPVTTSGTLTGAWATQAANKVFAGPTSGGSATPGFRTLVGTDYPTFIAAGSSHAQGAVPDPGATAYPNFPALLQGNAAWGFLLGQLFAYKFVAADETTTSTTDVTLTTADSVTFTLDRTENLLVLYFANEYTTNAVANKALEDLLYLDGTNITTNWSQCPNGVTIWLMATGEGALLTGVAAGSHTIEIKHRVDGAFTAHWRQRLLLVMRG